MNNDKTNTDTSNTTESPSQVTDSTLNFGYHPTDQLTSTSSNNQPEIKKPLLIVAIGALIIVGTVIALFATTQKPTPQTPTNSTNSISNSANGTNNPENSSNSTNNTDDTNSSTNSNNSEDQANHNPESSEPEIKPVTLSAEADDVSKTICFGNYNLIYQHSQDENDFIIQCTENFRKGDVHTIYGPFVDSSNPKRATVSTAYFGTNYERKLEEVFAGDIYLYIESKGSVNSRLFLLLPAENMSQLIEKSVSKLNAFIQMARSSGYLDYDDYDFEIYYNNDFSSVKTFDYVILPIIYGLDAECHSCGARDGKLHYYYIATGGNNAAVREIRANPDLYSKQVHDAIKNHEHLKFTISFDENYTADKIRTLLENSIRPAPTTIP